MLHLGDITKISGYDAPVVDCIIGGSPCQDLSIAGKRAGLAGERSGLFMEQIRIIKEMREADVLRGRTAEFIRPRYMVWENVPGAFSSNGGKDFAAVIEEIIKICEPDADVQVCVPDKGWTKSGCYYSEDGRWSVAWRVHDAQFWGVPQRRKRIALVADLGGLSAPEILFERKGLHWNPEQGKQKREETARAFGNGTDLAGKSRNMILDDQGGQQISVRYDGKCPTLRAEAHGNVPCTLGFEYRAGAKSGSVASGIEISPTLLGGRNDTAVFDARGNGNGKIAPTMTGDHQNRVTDYTSLVCEPTYCIQGNCIDRADTAGCNGKGWTENVSYTLNTIDRPAVSCVDVGFFNSYEEQAPTLLARMYKDAPIVNKHIVRRLTPLECERLQGYPDGWTDIGDWVDSKGKTHKASDSPRYKALGNSIALPYWKVLLKRISAQYDRDATMASLFDGIGGFPYIWEQLNGKGSCLWASEIEEFPMAVTKVRFP